MEALDAPISQTAAAATQPAPAAAPAPAAVAPVSYAPSSADSGSDSGGGSIKDVFKSLNWTEVAFGVLGTAALYYTIYY